MPEVELRYTLRAGNSAGPVSFDERLTIEAALEKAAELKDAGFHHITIINQNTGTEITDLEQFIQKLSRPL